MAIEASQIRASFGDSVIMERIEKELDEHLSRGRVRSMGKKVTTESGEGYEYQRTIVGVLTKEEATVLEDRYKAVGWTEASITSNPSLASTTARLFLKND